MVNIENVLTAIARNQVARFKKLVTAKNIDAVDEDGFTLLMNVVLDDETDAEMARHLIELGADVDRPDSAGDGTTALGFAVRDSRPEIAKLLLQAGANATSADARGNTPLHFAIQAQAPNLEIIDLLLARGADPRRKNGDGDSPLAMAKWGGAEWRAVVTLFQQSGRRPKGRSRSPAKRVAPKSRVKTGNNKRVSSSPRKAPKK
jgi:ankyrin repeat protein